MLGTATRRSDLMFPGRVFTVDVEAMAIFHDAWVRGLEKLYLMRHHRLPGSNRTARLRKKRVSVMMKWHRQYSRRERQKFLPWLYRNRTEVARAVVESVSVINGMTVQLSSFQDRADLN